MITPRQTEILVCLANGWTSKETAIALGISHETVKRHLTRAYDRLGVQTATPGSHSRIEAFRALGWLQPPTTEDVP